MGDTPAPRKGPASPLCLSAPTCLTEVLGSLPSVSTLGRSEQTLVPCFLPVKDDQEAVLCFYKTAKDCVMMFTYMELASGKSNLTVLREPGGSDRRGSSASNSFPCSGLVALCPPCLSRPPREDGHDFS